MKAIKASLSGDKTPVIKGILVGVLAAVAIILILISITAVVLYKTGTLPYKIINYVLAAILAIGVFFGSLISSKIIKEKGFLYGVLCAAIIFVITFAVGISASDSTISAFTLIKAVVLLVFGAIGGVVGVNQKDRIHIK